MAIRYDNPQLTVEEYNERRYQSILWLEENGKIQYKPYTDAKHGGWATMGIGFKITDNLGAILNVLGFKDNPVDNQYRQQIRDLFYSTNPQTGVETEKRFTSASMTTLYNDLNTIMQTRYNYYAALGDTSKRKQFRFDNQSEVKTAFLNAVQTYETRLNNWLGGVNVPPSYERIALLSRIYNGVQTSDLQKAISDGNRAEAWFWMRYSGYLARNNQGVLVEMNGLVKRRFAESELFGLYNDSTNVDVIEAKEVYQMFEKYRTTIAQKEALYGISLDGTRGNKLDVKGRTPFEAANADYKTILTAYLVDGKVDNLVDELDPAKDALYEYLYERTDLIDIENKLTANNIISTNIYLNPHKSTDTDQFYILDSFPYQTGLFENGADDLMIGMDQVDHMYGRKGNDILIGEDGADSLLGEEGRDVLYGGKGDDFLFGGLDNDVMYGGEGNDVFWGDEGNDLMYGGLDNDTYIIDPGDGNDTIEDQAGDNTVYLCGKELKFFYNTGDNETYISDDGNLTLQKSTGKVTDADHNIEVTLNENFAEGDFGITLIDLPDDIPALPDPEISTTIVGDLTPIDMDPVEAGVQYGYDQWGNVIVDPDLPDPGRSDVLHDTTGSDKIEGLGGDDVIFINDESSTGDWVLGGDGNGMIDSLQDPQAHFFVDKSFLSPILSVLQP